MNEINLKDYLTKKTFMICNSIYQFKDVRTIRLLHDKETDSKYIYIIRKGKLENLTIRKPLEVIEILSRFKDFTN